MVSRWAHKHLHPKLCSPLLVTKNLDGDISATKTGTGDGLVSRQPYFLRLLISWNSRFLDFWIWWPYLGNKKSYCRSAGGKMTWFWIPEFLVALYQRQKELPETHWSQNHQMFQSFSDFWKHLDLCILNFRNSEFLDFLIGWRYWKNEKSYQRSAEGKMNGISRAFQIFSKQIGFLNFGISLFSDF